MHVHLSALDALVSGLYFIIWGFILRWVATRYPDSSFGKALAFIH